jgi:hypothetical protein
VQIIATGFAGLRFLWTINASTITQDVLDPPIALDRSQLLLKDLIFGRASPLGYQIGWPGVFAATTTAGPSRESLAQKNRSKIFLSCVKRIRAAWDNQ